VRILREIIGWVAPLGILAAGVGAFWMLGSQPPPARRESDSRAAVPVETVPVQPESPLLDIVADGVVVPLREVSLAAEVSGRIVEKSQSCRSGRFVSKGDVLLRIDPRDYEFEVERLQREQRQAGLAIEEVEEEIAQNAASAALAERQVEIARREVARLDGLKAGRIVTESEHERAVRDELTAAARLSDLQGQSRVLAKRRHRLQEALSLSATLLERAKLDLERTTIRSPVAGMVVDDRVELDSFVSKASPLVTIEDTAAAEVRTSLQMEDVARIWGGRRNAETPLEQGLPDTPATVVYRLGEKRYAWQGTLSRQEGRGLDDRTRTLPCRVLVPDPGDVQALDRYGAVLPTVPPEAPRTLMRGMFVEVRVHVEAMGALVSLPEAAQRPSGEVWLVRDGRLVVAHPRPLEVREGRIIVEAAASGLESGDRVVVTQLSMPREGTAVVERGGGREPLKTAAAAED
jgi:biotin carboxyl carrier protein